MRTIICKKCGMEIDATLGECPNCGAVYYILPEDQEQAQNQPNFFDEPSNYTPKTQQNSAPGVHDDIDIENAMNDDIFNTSVWRNNDDLDSTRVFNTQPTAPQRKPAPAPRRPVQQEVPQRSRQNVRSAPPPPPPKKKVDVRKRQMIVAAVALLALLTLVLSIMSGAFDFSGKENPDNIMKKVIGLTEESATAMLEGMGLEVKSMQEPSDELAGTVIDQSIKEGKKIKKGDVIMITVAAAKEEETPEAVEQVKVPSLVGKTYDQAFYELSSVGLLVTSAEDVYDDTVEKGKVVTQNPSAGTQLKKGDLVTITVSKGKAPFKITVTAGSGGTVSPKGVVEVESGKDVTFTITPDAGYEVREVKVNGADIGPVNTYTFTGVTSNQTLYVVFQKKQEEVPSPDFESPSLGQGWFDGLYIDDISDIFSIFGN